MVARAAPPTDVFTQISAGENHACGVHSNGTVACWGRNDHGDEDDVFERVQFFVTVGLDAFAFLRAAFAHQPADEMVQDAVGTNPVAEDAPEQQRRDDQQQAPGAHFLHRDQMPCVAGIGPGMGIGADIFGQPQTVGTDFLRSFVHLVAGDLEFPLESFYFESGKIIDLRLVSAGLDFHCNDPWP